MNLFYSYHRCFILRIIQSVILLGLCLPVATLAAETKVVHVVVALCDNIHQRIVPVPVKLGNGEDSANNLYWGAMYGIKSYFKRSDDWLLISSITNPTNIILERVIFKKKNSSLWLIADAYRGANIRDATFDFLRYAAGQQTQMLSVEQGNRMHTLTFGGGSSLVAYLGHNGLMDFSIQSYPKAVAMAPRRPLVVLACASKNYFTEAIQASGAKPLVLTTQRMAPEAYTLHAIINGWFQGANDDAVLQQAAAAYAKYQKINIKAARKIFTN